MVRRLDLPARLPGFLGVPVPAADEVRSRPGPAVSRAFLPTGDHQSLGEHLVRDQFSLCHRGRDLGDVLALPRTARAASEAASRAVRPTKGAITVTVPRHFILLCCRLLKYKEIALPLFSNR